MFIVNEYSSLQQVIDLPEKKSIAESVKHLHLFDDDISIYEILDTYEAYLRVYQYIHFGICKYVESVPAGARGSFSMHELIPLYMVYDELIRLIKEGKEYIKSI